MRTVPRRSSLALLLAVAAAVAAPAVASADEGQIIVRYASAADAQDRADARGDADVVRAKALPLPQTELVTPERGTSVARAVADLERSGDVVYAEADASRSALDAAAPTGDPEFGKQWALQNTGSIFWSRTRAPYLGTAGDDIDVAPVWAQGITASPVTVGVVDTGADLAHPDLKANIVSGGTDYVDGDNTPDDLNGHGTHIAGIIGAVGNNGTGVRGVAWTASIMPVRVLDAGGSGRVSQVVAGYTWAANRARIVNVSLGGDTPSQAEYDAIRNAKDTLFVVAAGNDGVNVDRNDSYPCAYDLPNLICVAATDGDDELASWSDYGATSVDIAAPGVDILSTYPTALSSDKAWPYKWMSGTSMATPEVTGAAALVLGQDPELTPYQLREKILENAHPVAALLGKVATGGRLDVAAALAAAAPTDATPVSASVAPEARTSAPVQSAPATPVPATPAPATPAPTQPTPGVTRPAIPVPAVDRAAPTVSATLKGRGALRLLLAGRLRVSATASERAALRVELRLDARTAKKLRLTKRAAAVTLATGSGSLTAPGRTSVKVRVGAKAKRALARLRSVKVSLRATATDAAGNGRTRSRTLTITR